MPLTTRHSKHKQGITTATKHKQTAIKVQALQPPAQIQVNNRTSGYTLYQGSSGQFQAHMW